jgi:hypothetical protein
VASGTRFADATMDDKENMREGEKRVTMSYTYYYNFHLGIGMGVRTQPGRNLAIIGAILLLIYGVYVLANTGVLTALFG